MTPAAMNRFYLYVPPEEYAVVEASGAAWDDSSKRWYVPGSSAPDSIWTRWLGDEPGETEFTFLSDAASVAVAQTPCLHCHKLIEVICLYCQTGLDVDQGQPLVQFTVLQVWAMDEALAAQLTRWPMFRRVASDSGETSYANHCPHCGATQEDYRLHAEPGDVFFGIEFAESMKFVPLEGMVRLSGDCSFEV